MDSSSRASGYETKYEEDSLEDLSTKLTKDLRCHIQSLGAYAVGTTHWLEMSDKMKRIANISEMERKLPKQSEDSTLWECEELALRYILEDGKLNLCLRNLVDYYSVKKEAMVRGNDKEFTPAMDTAMQNFEKGSCIMLKNAWMHSEALQTTDLPLLLHFIRDVLEGAVTGKTLSANLEFTVDQMVIYFLKGIGLSLENDQIVEERVMAIIMEDHTLVSMCKHLHLNQDLLSDEDLRVGYHSLALLFNTEDFGTRRLRYFAAPGAVDALLDLEPRVLSFTEDDRETRRELRPLLDTLTYFQNQGASRK